MQQIKLVIKRKKQLAAFALAVDLTINGYPVAAIGNGKSITLDLNPGWHNIVLRLNALIPQEKTIYNVFEHDTMIEFYFNNISGVMEANFYSLPPGQY